MYMEYYRVISMQIMLGTNLKSLFNVQGSYTITSFHYPPIGPMYADTIESLACEKCWESNSMQGQHNGISSERGTVLANWFGSCWYRYIERQFLKLQDRSWVWGQEEVFPCHSSHISLLGLEHPVQHIGICLAWECRMGTSQHMRLLIWLCNIKMLCGGMRPRPR